MRASRLAGKIHRWLALIIGAQVVLWFASGTFISFVPIERVRGEHLARKTEAPVLQTGVIAPSLVRILASADCATRIEVRSLLGQPVVAIECGDARPRLFDLRDGRQISPLTGNVARRIAIADYAGRASPTSVALVTEETTQYRGPLPAWRVEFGDDQRTALYVPADTGNVAARRTDLWRTYDFLWGLHIMDWSDHENINYPWLWGTAAAALAMALSGIVLFPSRFGWRRRRRRQADHAA